jgi:hypothetical protein
VQVDAAEEWLTALDAEPSALLAWLRKQRNYGKLGFYFAALLEYWARFCPVLGTTGTTTWGFLPGGRLMSACKHHECGADRAYWRVGW